MRGTALVVLLCVSVVFAAHLLTDAARARDVAADEMAQPDCGEPVADCVAAAAIDDGSAPPTDDSWAATPLDVAP